MKIGIDISLQCMPRSGIGQYQYNLIKNLLMIDKKNFYHLYAFNYRWRHKFNQLKFSGAENYKVSVTPIPQRLMTIWWIFVRYPYLEQVTKPCDVYHISETCVQPTRLGRKVAVIHDLTTLLYPEYHLKQNIFFYNRRFKDIKKYADAVITESESTKNDIIRHLNIDPQKIFVTHFAADESFRPIKENEVKKKLSKFNIQKPYIMFLGTLEPRKNIPTLIRAFTALKKKKNIPHKLVLVGQKGWFFQEIEKALEESLYRDEIIFPGYIPDEDIPALYNGAEIFVYPSFYEGFGLPVLEAMQCGTPVITSNISSMPEIGGDACYYIEPKSLDDLTRGLEKIIENTDLRKKMSQKGIERAKQFSWEKCAKETLRIYTQTAGKS